MLLPGPTTITTQTRKGSAALNGGQASFCRQRRLIEPAGRKWPSVIEDLQCGRVTSCHRLCSDSLSRIARSCAQGWQRRCASSAAHQETEQAANTAACASVDAVVAALQSLPPNAKAGSDLANPLSDRGAG